MCHWLCHRHHSCYHRNLSPDKSWDEVLTNDTTSVILREMKPEPFSYNWEKEPHTDFEVIRAILKDESSWSMGDEMRTRALKCLKRIEKEAKKNEQTDETIF